METSDGAAKVQQIIDRSMGIHEQALQLRAYRANVLASNIANADTPGYKAQDLDFKRILHNQVAPSGVGEINVRKTRSRHLGHDPVIPGAHTQYRNPLQASLDGNTVDAHAEYTRFSQNTVQYQASLQFLSGRFKSMMTAIKGE
ncbi:MAG: flagellar basal body rod protein FlgB [Pseudomonadota bacterium]